MNVGMTYSEWVIANWERSTTYLDAVARIKRCKQNIAELQEDIATAERGEVPERHKALFGGGKPGTFSAFAPLVAPTILDVSEFVSSVVFGIDPVEHRINKWEQEAVEAEEKRQRDFDFFLSRYRDGKDPFDRILNTPPEQQKLEYGSLPYHKNELGQLEQALKDCKPVKPYDWRNKDDMDSERWFEQTQSAVNDMLTCLGMSRKHSWNFNELYANAVHDLSEQGFRIALWIGAWGKATCSIGYAPLRTKQVIRRGWQLWDATLYALADFLDANWEVLIAQRDEFLAELRDLGVNP